MDHTNSKVEKLNFEKKGCHFFRRHTRCIEQHKLKRHATNNEQHKLLKNTKTAIIVKNANIAQISKNVQKYRLFKKRLFKNASGPPRQAESTARPTGPPGNTASVSCRQTRRPPPHGTPRTAQAKKERRGRRASDCPSCSNRPRRRPVLDTPLLTTPPNDTFFQTRGPLLTTAPNDTP